MITYKLSVMVWNMSSSVLWPQPTLPPPPHSLHIVSYPGLIQASFHTMLQKISPTCLKHDKCRCHKKEWSNSKFGFHPQAHRRQRTKPLFNVIMYHILHYKKKKFNFNFLVTAAILFRQQNFCSCFKNYDIVENWFESYELILHMFTAFIINRNSSFCQNASRKES